MRGNGENINNATGLISSRRGIGKNVSQKHLPFSGDNAQKDLNEFIEYHYPSGDTMAPCLMILMNGSLSKKKSFEYEQAIQFFVEQEIEAIYDEEFESFKKRMKINDDNNSDSFYFAKKTFFNEIKSHYEKDFQVFLKSIHNYRNNKRFKNVNDFREYSELDKEYDYFVNEGIKKAENTLKTNL